MPQDIAPPSALAFPPLDRSVTKAEWAARVDLAACYRLVDHFDMSDMIYTHISVRHPERPDRFLLNQHGLLFGEMTASSFLEVDVTGKIHRHPDPSRGYGLHAAGFVIHSAIYKARPDVGAVLHTHTIAGMALSSLACGLTPLTQTSHRFYGRVAYHDFNGPERDPAEREKLAKSLGSLDVMILRNHGLLTVGPTVPEAFNRMYGLERAAKAQLAAMACNTPLEMPSDDVIAKSTAMYAPGATRSYGILEWPGLLRLLDRNDPSYRS
ncbi:MAG TPA: class II aldolase/adducin family protein [Hyphomicrobiaceae bacterium]|nr:class II aldolase/adducin family protein [Hyphomicrobiaceae bacterium]